MTKNRLCDLNDHLFAQIERLADEDSTPEKIDQEHKRAEAMVGVADQILRTAAVQLQTAKMVTDFDGADPRPYLTMMEKPGSNLPALKVVSAK
ncbi:hypothetical protein [Nitrobacter sp. Nb-311A]|uniref:hypothetical protein n=1 Tax=Nitrobacter sp. Nb-311A TaxID=314253 RepID=UPI000680C861|nr:hypothetical protein [Nitrobacter sp. Nb-311A]